VRLEQENKAITRLVMIHEQLLQIKSAYLVGLAIMLSIHPALLLMVIQLLPNMDIYNLFSAAIQAQRIIHIQV
ncbi:MAG: hypothetical protein SPC26_00730, partial [Lactobacillus amylovorus]|nr:hypothetical protein [Lactobacillus amylovorus]